MTSRRRVLAVDYHAGEGKHEHSGNSLQDGKSSQCHFGVSGFQDVPGHGGRVHPAAHHGDQVGGKNETQGTPAEDATPSFYSNRGPRNRHDVILALAPRRVQR